MGRAIVVRTDYTSGDVRRVAQRVKNAAQARRLLAIAAALECMAEPTRPSTPIPTSTTASGRRSSGVAPCLSASLGSSTRASSV